jgi:hypothetical protein
VNTEELVRIEPQLVFWQFGEQPDPKTIHIAIDNDASVKVVRVRSDNPAFKVKLVETESGRGVRGSRNPFKTDRRRNLWPDYFCPSNRIASRKGEQHNLWYDQ